MCATREKPAGIASYFKGCSAQIEYPATTAFYRAVVLYGMACSVFLRQVSLKEKLSPKTIRLQLQRLSPVSWCSCLALLFVGARICYSSVVPFTRRLSAEYGNCFGFVRKIRGRGRLLRLRGSEARRASAGADEFEFRHVRLRALTASRP